MTKLADIIDAATGDTVPTATLLRMVRVVAARLDTIELETWVERELSGYTEDQLDELPPYRGPFAAPVLGHFVGPFGSDQRLPIPPGAMPKYRDTHLFKAAFLQPVSALDELRRATENLQIPWSADQVGAFNSLVEDGEAHGLPMHQLVEAWRLVSPQQVTGALDQVRNRVLTLALALEKIAPRAGEPEAPRPDAATVTNVVNNNIYGHGNNVAVNSPHASQATTVHTGDLESLLSAVREIGLPEADVTDLERAIGDDARTQDSTTEPGPAVTRFLGRLALKGDTIAGKIAIGATGGTIGGTITALIKAYYGIN